MPLRSFPKLYQLALKSPRMVLLLALLLSLVSLWAVQKLRIKNDLVELLPRNTESVENLKKLQKYFGGNSYLSVTVESTNEKTTEEFALALAGRIEKLPEVRYVDYKRPVEFFRDRFWFYVETADLEEILKRVDRSLALQEKGISPAFNSLVDFADAQDRPDLEFKDIVAKYKQKVGIDPKAEEIQEPSGSTREGNFAVLQIKAQSYAENLDANKILIEGVRKIADALKKERGDTSTQVRFAGDYVRSLEDVAQIEKEVGLVSALVTLALFLILFFYFRSLGALFLIGLPLLAGVVWTGGLLYLLFGHLSIITAFGAAILGGLGSDYGIFLLDRYTKEREAGKDLLEAATLAFGSTGRSTHASMVITVGSFVALLFSDFEVFIEFGALGALGLIANYVAMMMIVPALLTFSESHRKNRFFKWLTRWNYPQGFSFQHLSKTILSIFKPKGAKIGIALVVLLCGLSALVVPRQSKIYFEDGQLSFTRTSEDPTQRKVDKVVPQSFNPTVLMVRGAADESRLVQALRAHLGNDLEMLFGRAPRSSFRAEDRREWPPALNEIFTHALGRSSFVPPEQEKKREILAKIRVQYEKLRIPLKKTKADFLATLARALQSYPITPEALPVEIQRRFVSFADPNLFAVYLFPINPSASAENARILRNAAKSVMELARVEFSVAHADFIADDTVKLIEKEAPRGIALLLIFLGIVLAFVVRPFGRAFLIFLQLIGSLLILFGLLWIARFHLNIINISAFPIILGTGIDCFIHLSHHFDETGELERTLMEDVPPILLSSVTSIIGFAGLLFTSSEGLRSIGWVAVLGLSIVMGFAVLVFPRFLSLPFFRGRKRLLPK